MSLGLRKTRGSTEPTLSQPDPWDESLSGGDDPWGDGSYQTENAPVSSPPYQAPSDTPPPASTPAAPKQLYSISGWDSDKMNDPNHNTSKYMIGRILAGFDPNKGITPDVINALNGLGIGTFSSDGGDGLHVSGGRDDFGGMNVWDAIRGYKAGDGNASWQFGVDSNLDPPPGSGGNAGNGGYTGTGGYGGTGGSGGYGYNNGGSNSSSFSVNIGGVPTDINSELWTMLMNRAKQGLNVDRTNPVIRNQADAYSAQEERARRIGLTEAAEKGSPYATGHQAGLERLSAAQMGQRVGDYEAQLVGQEIKAKRDEIAQALSEMGDLLTDQQKMSLQMKIAEMDNSLERLKSDRQDAQFGASLNQNDRQFGADMGFKYAGLGQENNHFLDTLGFNQQKEQNHWDWLQQGGSEN